MKNADLKEYHDLIEAFSCERISGKDFEESYLTLFKADKRNFPREVFEILNGLFSDVDAFVSDSSLRTFGDLDEKQLLECARKALRSLNTLCTE